MPASLLPARVCEGEGSTNQIVWTGVASWRAEAQAGPPFGSVDVEELGLGLGQEGSGGRLIARACGVRAVVRRGFALAGTVDC